MPTRPPIHRPPGWRPPKELAAEYERQRGSPSARGYGADWGKFRIGYLRQHPICEDCLRRGHLTPATELHHLVKPRVAPHLRLVASNVRALCESCHSIRTRRGE